LLKAQILLQARRLLDCTRLRVEQMAVSPVGGKSNSMLSGLGRLSGQHPSQSHQRYEAATEPEETRCISVHFSDSKDREQRTTRGHAFR
jgi:hypothetical protein